MLLEQGLKSSSRIRTAWRLRCAFFVTAAVGCEVSRNCCGIKLTRTGAILVILAGTTALRTALPGFALPPIPDEFPCKQPNDCDGANGQQVGINFCKIRLKVEKHSPDPQLSALHHEISNGCCQKKSWCKGAETPSDGELRDGGLWFTLGV